MIHRPLAAAGLALLLGACSSATTQYYTLLSVPEKGTPALLSSPFQLEVQTVRVPVQVDQPQLVVHQGGGRLAILETERWGAPLADEFRAALTDRLERDLGIRDLAGLPKDERQPVMSLRTDVRRFDMVPGHYARSEAVWSLTFTDTQRTRRTLTCSSTLEVPAGNELESLVVAHQRAVTRLADTIAAAMQAFAKQADAICPGASPAGTQDPSDA